MILSYPSPCKMGSSLSKIRPACCSRLKQTQQSYRLDTVKSDRLRDSATYTCVGPLAIYKMPIYSQIQAPILKKIKFFSLPQTRLSGLTLPRKPSLGWKAFMFIHTYILAPSIFSAPPNVYLKILTRHKCQTVANHSLLGSVGQPANWLPTGYSHCKRKQISYSNDA